MTSTSREAPVTALLIGEDSQLLEHTRGLLLAAGISPVVALADSSAAVLFLEQQDVEVIVLDMTPVVISSGLLTQICTHYPETRVLVVTDSTEVNSAVSCMKSGAFDYLVRPFEPARLIAAVAAALQRQGTQQEADNVKEYFLHDRLEHAEAFAEIKSVCRRMRAIFHYTELVACSPQAILISGETGVGKELFAKAIHRISEVRGPFVSINVAGLDDAMFSDTLFGHKKGAFTGADQYRDGLVSKASMGTLFLDEIGDLNELSQVKLLRLLQEQEYYPVGADQVRMSTARIVLATNVNLPERIREGRFRRDLYYRLCTHQIHVPALRERREDIPLLVDSFVKEAAERFAKCIPAVSAELLDTLAVCDFPGNVRELKARISDAIVRSEDAILSTADFPDICVQQQTPVLSAERSAGAKEIYSLFGRLPTFREIEDYLLVEAMKLSEGNYAEAASILGVTRQTISKRLKSIEFRS